jgi:hypothetical protein
MQARREAALLGYVATKAQLQGWIDPAAYLGLR